MYLQEEFSEKALKEAETITLRDLLESPTFQSWIVSAMGNALRFRDQFKGSDSHIDEYTQFKVQRVTSEISHAQKLGLYQTTNNIIKQNKAQQLSNANR